MPARLVLRFFVCVLLLALAWGASEVCNSRDFPANSCPLAASMTSATNTQDGGDYFVLSISWAPSFCCNGAARNKPCSECATAAQQSNPFYVHGLWPQCRPSTNGPAYPQFCCVNSRQMAMFNPLPADLATACNAEMDSTAEWCTHLGGHEWAKHGTCSGMSARDYFKFADDTFDYLKPSLDALTQDILNPDREVARGNRALRQAYMSRDDILSYFPEGSVFEINAGRRSSIVNELRICFMKQANSSIPDISAAGMQCRFGTRIDEDKYDYFFALPCNFAQCKTVHDSACRFGEPGPACNSDADCCALSGCSRCARSGYCTVEPPNRCAGSGRPGDEL